MADLVCWNCGASLADVPRPISRHANCSGCFEVLHCCRMCRHYEPDRRPYCGHDRAEPPVVKENANFCDYFKPANRFSQSDSSRADQAKSSLNSLFGEDEIGAVDATDDLDCQSTDGRGDDSAGDPGDPLNKLNDLFDD